MKLIVQRVSKAAVQVDGKTTAQIGKGMLILIGAEKGDTTAEAQALAQKISALRIFEDEQGKMNLAAQAVGAAALVVSQFTLAADLSRGNRPSFDSAERPEQAQVLIECFVACLKATGIAVEQGCFGARMAVELVNDGPVTFGLEHRCP